jgi:hypothetical protein
MRFYAESIEITKELLNLEEVKLAAMHDVDLRSGEWESIICGGKKEKSVNNNANNNKLAGDKLSLFLY